MKPSAFWKLLTLVGTLLWSGAVALLVTADEPVGDTSGASDATGVSVCECLNLSA